MSVDDSASAAVARALTAKTADAAAGAAQAATGPHRWEDVAVRWEVVADGCCETCGRWHGQVMGLAELEQNVMPLGGPVHGCEHGGGCGCAAMPVL